MRMLVLAAGLISTPALAQSISIDGDCPGPADIEITGVTPGASVVLLIGTRGLGSDAIPGGPCRDLTSGLAGISKGPVLRDADRDGVITVSTELRPGWCDAALQVVEPDTCALSDAVPVSGGVGGDINTFEWLGRDGWLLYDYGIAGEEASADFACAEAGLGGARDWDVEFIGLSPWTCWCYEPSGEVRTPCCSGASGEAWFITDIRCD
jgi:hypothetical protein